MTNPNKESLLRLNIKHLTEVGQVWLYQAAESVPIAVIPSPIGILIGMSDFQILDVAGELPGALPTSVEDALDWADSEGIAWLLFCEGGHTTPDLQTFEEQTTHNPEPDADDGEPLNLFKDI